MKISRLQPLHRLLWNWNKTFTTQSKVKFRTYTVVKPKFLLNNQGPFNVFTTTSNNQGRMMSSEVNKISTAGIIIIGNEILKGQSQDTNSFFMSKHLHDLGVSVERVIVIPDDLDVIAKTVREFSQLYTHVITSGGVGPTHDDCTYEGVALAFEEKLQPHPFLANFIKNYFKTEERIAAAMKMAMLPESAKLHFGENKETGEKSRYPVVGVNNVIVFPGVPHLLQRAFTILAKQLFHRPGASFSVKELYLDIDEVGISAALNQTVEKYSNVQIGSYPKIFHSYYKTKITMESVNSGEVESAQNFFKDHIPHDVVVDYDPDTISDPWPYIKLLSSKDSTLAKLIKESVAVLEDCFKQYKPEEICVCYNGGKDCLVALHLTYAIHKKLHPNSKLQAMYVTEEHPFPQVSEFVQQSINRYNLDCKIQPGPIKTAIKNLSDSSSIKAMIMGTRKSDPYSSNLEPFSQTDDNWPSMMRINPILNWQYNDIWGFIRGLYLPYCNLYDRGYTSLGNRNNSFPNPALQSQTTTGDISYLPAYRLMQPELERHGRLLSKQ